MVVVHHLQRRGAGLPRLLQPHAARDPGLPLALRRRLRHEGPPVQACSHLVGQRLQLHASGSSARRAGPLPRGAAEHAQVRVPHDLAPLLACHLVPELLGTPVHIAVQRVVGLCIHDEEVLLLVPDQRGDGALTVGLEALHLLQLLALGPVQLRVGLRAAGEARRRVHVAKRGVQIAALGEPSPQVRHRRGSRLQEVGAGQGVEDPRSLRTGFHDGRALRQQIEAGTAAAPQHPAGARLVAHEVLQPALQPVGVVPRVIYV